MQRVHFQVRVGVQLSRQTFISLTLILWEKQYRMWFSVVSTLTDNDTRHHSGQNVVDSSQSATN